MAYKGNRKNSRHLGIRRAYRAARRRLRVLLRMISPEEYDGLVLPVVPRTWWDDDPGVSC
jgi:hypothetical protein